MSYRGSSSEGPRVHYASRWSSLGVAARGEGAAAGAGYWTCVPSLTSLLSAPTKENLLIIPGLRDDPKIVGRDDTKVVGDSVAKAVPFFGNSSPKEAQDCRSELGAGFCSLGIGPRSTAGSFGSSAMKRLLRSS